MSKPKIIFALAFIVIMVGFGWFILAKTKPQTQSGLSGNFKLEKFKSAEDFKNYLTKTDALQSRNATTGLAESSTDVMLAAPKASGVTGAGEASRVSTTNVQVTGIDEPDILKTNGKEIFYSGESDRFLKPVPMMDSVGSAVPPLYRTGQTKIINAFPMSDLVKKADIEQTGEMLLVDKTLVIFGVKIIGYNVADPASPQKIWELSYGENSSLVSARLSDGKIYLVTQSYLNRGVPCPVKPMAGNEVSCLDIYHPVEPVNATATYHAMVLAPVTGQIEKTVSFVGAAGKTDFYLSYDNLYLAFSVSPDQFKILSGFIKENSSYFPAELSRKVSQLESYDLSTAAKLTELQIAIANYETSFSEKEAEARRKEYEKRYQEYLKRHKRELSSTGLVKIRLNEMAIVATQTMPGTLLNQFSMDEYKNNLRLAVTVGEEFGWSANSNSASDVYILDPMLKELGSIKDLGETERIYSVRFIADRGYVVTFRQTDPFYVLDLSRASNPGKKGELKIPGYSSYLHPLSENEILGIGKEGAQVKISLFNVKNATEPQEISKLELDEYWSEALSNHHAFLADEKYKVFFIPGSTGGQIISYADGKLTSVKSMTDADYKRALYLNDNFYLVSASKISVFDEKNWEKVKELTY